MGGCGDHRQKKGHWMCRRQQERPRATRAHHVTHRRSCKGRKGSGSSVLHDSHDRPKDSPMRSADATGRAAGQRPEHWGSHVSPGAKPQRCSRPSAHTIENSPFELPAQRSQRRLSEALFLCGAWTQNFLLPRNC